MAPGILFVFSDPGHAVSDAEYNDWYDNEHVPLRIPIPAFHSWSRWAAIDGKKPSYLALYDLSDVDAVNQPPYADLASSRTVRETDILSRIALLDRRTYQSLPVPVPPRDGDAYSPLNPGILISVLHAQIPPEHEDDFNNWYNQEHVAMLAKSPHWVRTSRYTLRDSGASGTDDSLKPTATFNYLALHEWSDPAVFASPEFKAAIETPWAKNALAYPTALDVRLFKLLRTWDRQ